MLEMLRAIIEKFPKTVVDDQSQTLFIHLLVCLTNDQDKDVRLMTGTVIKLLISRITTRSVHLSIDRGISWYMGENPQLWSAAAQVYYLNWLSATASALSISFSFFFLLFLG